ncbi:MAG: nucleotidyltransferase [Lachnospiraceae bacterium]
MKVVGLITEYNPFHNGHKYHIEESKKITNADYCVIVMSGNFTQRGTPAIIDKYTRAQMALENGADLVLELPTFYATSSADYFSLGSISLLNSLGVIDSLCFGSEIGDINIIREISSFLLTEPKEYQMLLQENLAKGNSFPLARSKTLEYFFKNLPSSFLHSPNNILGIEYCKSLLLCNSQITPYTINRIANNYHDKTLNTLGVLSSATSIRSELSNGTFETLKEHVPSNVYTLLSENYNKTYPIYPNDFSSLLLYKLVEEEPFGYTKYFDVSQSISDRISNHLNYFQSFDQFCNLLKTKDITHSRISRCLSHILLNITTNHASTFLNEPFIHYARILGLNPSATSLMQAIKKSSCIPLISKVSKAHALLTECGKEMLSKDIISSNIYSSIQSLKFETTFTHELKKQIKKP